MGENSWAKHELPAWRDRLLDGRVFREQLPVSVAQWSIFREKSTCETPWCTALVDIMSISVVIHEIRKRSRGVEHSRGWARQDTHRC